MTTAHFIDDQPVRESFCQWHAEQQVLDAQLAESVAALEAYQSHLDAWQRELAVEREELSRLRAELDRDQALSGSHDEQAATFRRELSDARQKITSLTTALLTRTEELRELDRLRVQTDRQLSEAKSREKELLAALAVERNRVPTNDKPPSQPPSPPRERTQSGEPSPVARQAPANGLATNGRAPNGQAANGQAVGGRPSTEPNKSANPVLGSVMEQFGKLRQQRSLDRQNYPKPR